jgi:crotonobetainyl-CoA:carnitine CoA-transferase CaiB-like acyl-CoA transferase
MLNAEDVNSDPHLIERGMIVKLEHPVRGEFVVPGDPIQLSDSRSRIGIPPLLGQHTEEVLRELLDMGPEEIGELREANVI